MAVNNLSIPHLENMVANLSDGENLMSEGALPVGVSMEGGWYRCLLCCVKAPSKDQLRIHLDGKRHRYNVLRTALKRNRDALLADKENITIKCDYDDENRPGNIRFDGNQNQDIVLKIHNNRESGSVTLKRFEKLVTFNAFRIDQAYRRISHIINSGTTFEVKVHFRTNGYGRFVTPVVLFFKSENNTQFCIVRCLHAVRMNKIIQDLQPTMPFHRLQKVHHQRGRTFRVDGYPLRKIENNQLEREIVLDPYCVPDYLRSKNILSDGATRDLLEKNLTMETYKEKFSLLLYIEQLQMEVDIRQYDMEGVTMEICQQNKRLLRLKVPGLIEKRPSVLKGDYLYATIIGEVANIEYKGWVHDVRLDEVWLGFGDQLMQKFLRNTKFNVRFTINHLPAKLQHRAVKLAEEHSLSPLLFPQNANNSEQPALWDINDTLRLYDRTLSDNVEQSQAIRHILAGTSRPAPYIVFGPPGTGKTVTIVEAMKQIYSLLPKSHILACAPSNSAANLLAERLLSHVEQRHIMRLNALSQPIDAIPEKIKKCCNYKNGEVFFPPKEKLQKYRVIVCTLITAGRLVSANFSPGHFTHIFIDEAGQAVEPEGVVPLAGIIDSDAHVRNAGQVVLVGDPEQLGPVLRSRVAIDFGLDLSLLERLMKKCDIYKRNCDATSLDKAYDKRLITKLVRNYRSHPDILEQPNELFYNKELIPCADKLIRESLCQWDKLKKKNFPVIFHGILGEEMREETSPSFFNPEEVERIHYYVNCLLDMKMKLVKPKDIGIIAPYRKQVQKIKHILKNQPEIRIGSVEEFQGREKLVIIVSTTRSNPDYLGFDVKCDMGFIKNPKRFNVAITRAKALLIVIGNPHILCRNHFWNSFVRYCQKKGAYTGCDFETEEEPLTDVINTLEDLNIQKDEPVISHITQEVDPPWRTEH